jgi:hypothetical protein
MTKSKNNINKLKNKCTNTNSFLYLCLLCILFMILFFSIIYIFKYYNIFNTIDSYENENEIKTCFIITGLLEKKFVDNVIETYKDEKHKIISIWLDQDIDIDLINNLKLNNFIIVQTEKPRSEFSTIFQSTAIISGINKAKELGFTHAIRSRVDLQCNNITLLKQILMNKYLLEPKLTCLSGIETDNEIYYLDFVIGGSLENLHKFFLIEDNKIKKTGTYDFPEKNWAKLYLNKVEEENLTREDIKKIFNFFINDCKENNISFIWLKTNENIITEYSNVVNGWI